MKAYGRVGRKKSCGTYRSHSPWPEEKSTLTRTPYESRAQLKIVKFHSYVQIMAYHARLTGTIRKSLQSSDLFSLFHQLHARQDQETLSGKIQIVAQEPILTGERRIESKFRLRRPKGSQSNAIRSLSLCANLSLCLFLPPVFIGQLLFLESTSEPGRAGQSSGGSSECNGMESAPLNVTIRLATCRFTDYK